MTDPLDITELEDYAFLVATYREMSKIPQAHASCLKIYMSSELKEVMFPQTAVAIIDGVFLPIQIDPRLKVSALPGAAFASDIWIGDYD